MAEPTARDYERLTNAVRGLETQVKSLGKALIALNTNLVAIHEVLKEKDA